MFVGIVTHGTIGSRPAFFSHHLVRFPSNGYVTHV